MLRNLQRRSPSNRLIAGTHWIGILAETIAAETAAGDNGPGLLYDRAINPSYAGKRLRLVATSLPAAGTLAIDENGASHFSGAPDGIYTLAYDEYADNVLIGADTATYTVGSVAGTAPAATLTGAGTIAGGGASATQSGTAPAATLSGAGTIEGGGADASGNGSAPAATLTGTGTIEGGGAFATGGGDATAPSATLSGTGTVVDGGASGQRTGSAPDATLTGTGQVQGGGAVGDLDGAAPAVELSGTGQVLGGGASNGEQASVCFFEVSIARPVTIGTAVTDTAVHFSRDIIMSKAFVEGEVARLHALITNEDGQPFDPAQLSLLARYGSAPESAYTYGVDAEITRVSQGRYRADIPLTQGGQFHFRWVVAGASDGAVEGIIVVRGSRFQ